MYKFKIISPMFCCYECGSAYEIFEVNVSIIGKNYLCKECIDKHEDDEE